METVKIKRRKSVNPIEQDLDSAVIEISNETFGDVVVLEILMGMMEKIEYCNVNHMYNVRDRAINTVIRRCKAEIEFARADCTDENASEVSRAIAKKYNLP